MHNEVCLCKYEISNIMRYANYYLFEKSPVRAPIYFYICYSQLKCTRGCLIIHSTNIIFFSLRKAIPPCILHYGNYIKKLVNYNANFKKCVMQNIINIINIINYSLEAFSVCSFYKNIFYRKFNYQKP